MALPLSSSARWLFIGDSITDCGRRECPDKLGNGYVRVIRDWLLARDPSAAPAVLNRGISGNKVTDLRDRWQADVLDLKPDLVSIKVGINDVWHGLNPGGTGVSPEDYRTIFLDLVEQVRTKLPEAYLVFCEPSVIVPPAPAIGNEKLVPYIEAVRELGAKFKSPVVPFHHSFQNALDLRPDISWAPDGVHPTSAGHMLLARTWLASLGLL